MDRPEIRVEPTSNPTSTNSEPLWDVQVAKQSRTAHVHMPTQIVAKVRMEDCFRRKEAIDEALAEELQRDEQRKQRDSRVTTAALAPAPKSVASTSHVLS